MMNYEIDYLANHLDFKSKIAQWIQSFWGEHYPERTLADWEESLYCYKDQIPFSLIAFSNIEDKNIPVGIASIRKNGMEGVGPNSDWLAGVFVPPIYRKRVIASVLIKRCIEVAKDLAVKELWLFTRTDGHLYEKLGWALDREIEYQGTWVKIMKNELS